MLSNTIVGKRRFIKNATENDKEQNQPQMHLADLKDYGRLESKILPERRLACAFLCNSNFTVPGSNFFLGRKVLSFANTALRFKALLDIFRVQLVLSNITRGALNNI